MEDCLSEMATKLGWAHIRYGGRQRLFNNEKGDHSP